MSYRNRKNKRSKIIQPKNFLRLACVKFFYNLIRIKKEKQKMTLIQIRKTTDALRSISKKIRANNPKISDWTDKYLTECFLDGKPLNILTQWCLSKALEKRFIDQGGFFPTKKEKRILQEEIPEIIQIFKRNGFTINWWITFNRSYLDDRLLEKNIETQYKQMVLSLAPKDLQNNVMFLDWEDEILFGRSQPDTNVLSAPQNYIKEGALDLEIERWCKWSQEEAGINQTLEKIKKDAIWQIACEANEGKFLVSKNTIFSEGKFLLVPLETPERFDNFSILSPEIKERIVPVLSFYPWRIYLES